MFRVINNAIHHHCTATPIEQVFRWHIYHIEDVPEDWPGNGQRLAMTLTAEQVDWLRANDKPGDFELLPLPIPDPAPEFDPFAEPEPEPPP